MQVNKQTNTHSLSPYLQCLPIFFSCNLNINAFVSNAFFPMDYVRSTMNCFCWWISLEAKHVKSFHSFCIVLISFGSCVCTIWSEKCCQTYEFVSAWQCAWERIFLCYTLTAEQYNICHLCHWYSANSRQFGVKYTLSPSNWRINIYTAE